MDDDSDDDADEVQEQESSIGHGTESVGETDYEDAMSMFAVSDEEYCRDDQKT